MISLRGASLFLAGIVLGLPLVAAHAVPLTALLETEILATEAERLPASARLEFVMPEGAPLEAERLVAAQHDLTTSSFATIAELASGEQVTLRGRVYAVIDVPLPARSIMPGEIAKIEDFEIRSMPVQGLGQFSVVELDAILGREVRRTLVSGRPVQAQSLQEPRVVRRGDRLTIQYTNGALELMAPGRALDDAAAGDTVRVQNLNSNKTVTAVALGDGRVQVR